MSTFSPFATRGIASIWGGVGEVIPLSSSRALTGPASESKTSIPATRTTCHHLILLILIRPARPSAPPAWQRSLRTRTSRGGSRRGRSRCCARPTTRTQSRTADHRVPLGDHSFGRGHDEGDDPADADCGRLSGAQGAGAGLAQPPVRVDAPVTVAPLDGHVRFAQRDLPRDRQSQSIGASLPDKAWRLFAELRRP